MRRGKSKWILIGLLVILIGSGTWVLLDPEARVLGALRGEPSYGGRYASAWLRDLGGTDSITRSVAGEKLKIGGVEAVPVLIFVLSADAPPEARWRAADVIGQIGPDAREAGPALVAALDDPDPTVRSVAARSLERLAPDVPEAVPALIARFPEVDAVRAVAKFRDPAAIPPLVELLSHPEPTIRRNAARSLGRLGELARSTTPQVAALLADQDASVRSHVAEALGFIGSPEAVPELARVLTDPDPVVRKEALLALGALKEAARPVLSQVRAAQADEDRGVREAAIRAERLIDPSVVGKQKKQK